VISIKKFLALNTDVEQALMHVVTFLMEGIGRHVTAIDTDHAVRFRKAMDEARVKLATDISAADLLVLAGSVVQALEDHAGRAAQDHQIQFEELQHMVAMLTGTVSAISTASQTNVGRLGEIEKQVTGISVLDDVRQIKARLGDCLADIRAEANRQQKVTLAMIEHLSQGLSDAQQSAPHPVTGSVVDAITGLPIRPAAEAALAEPARRDGHTFAAVMVLETLQSISRKFGKDVADEIMAEFARLVQQNLPRADRLFRWGGPTLVAVMIRAATVERVRSEIATTMAPRWEYNIRTPSGSVLLPLAARWAVMPTTPAACVLYQKIDSFANTSVN
jgi:GGDEF domain-containing protein